MRKWGTLLLFVACGGTNPPNLATDAAVNDLSGGDLGGLGCTPATTGFYVLTYPGSLALISPDPNEWEGTTVSLVDENQQPLSRLSFMTVIGDNFYAHEGSQFYQGTLSSIKDGKLTLTADALVALPGYSSTIAPNGNKGDLMVLYSTNGGYVGEITPGANTIFTPSNTQLSANCDFRDFEGTVSGDNVTLDAICTNEIDHVVNGGAPMTKATGTQGLLAGMQNYQGTVYVVSKVGGVYDTNLNLIKKTRQCTSNPMTYGKPLTVFSL